MNRTFFENKIAVITGGSRGIGRCVAERFSSLGTKIAVLDVLAFDGDCDLFFKGDMAEQSVLRSFSDKVKETFGGVDFLIHNACFSKKGLLSSCSYDDFLLVQKVGVAAPYLLTQLLSPVFSKDAAVVTICSTRAGMSQPDTESYSAAKGGILALTHAMAMSLRTRARVNSVSPGWIDTIGAPLTPADHAQHPVGRVGTPSDIADAVLFLCSPNSSFITGQNLTVDGGMSKSMIYSGDNGWSYSPLEEQKG